MAVQKYALAQAGGLLSLLVPPQAEVQRQILHEYLRNPFLDDDAQGLALRAQSSREEALQAAEALCQAGLLEKAGQRGYALALSDEWTATQASKVLALPVLGAPAPPEAAELIEMLPFGVLLLSGDGRPVLANERAHQWLEAAPGELDGETFAAITGFAPDLVLEGEDKVFFVLQQPRSLSVSMHACCVEGARGVLIVIEETSLLEETVQAQAYLQEELFNQLRAEVVGPVEAIRAFMENPCGQGLGQARAALERVGDFLETFLLDNPATRKSQEER
jgi:PAS domain-containing protein